MKARDQVAWERLVALFTPLVYGWCRRAGLQEADAQDVGQEVFRAVARGIASFRRDRPGDSFRAWLRTITVNKIRDFGRKQQGAAVAAGGTDAQRQMQQQVQELSDSTRQEAAEETKALFRRAVELIRAEFSDNYWRAFWQVVVLERSPADVAEDLGVSVNTVYLAKSRILQRVRAEFGELLDDGGQQAETAGA